MDYKDYYNTLGVGRDATQDEIRTAYRKLARKYHPDVSKETDAEARFKEVSEAYEVLKDAESRAAYDDLGRYRQGESFKPPPGWSGQSHGGADGAEQFSDFFRNLFGEGRGGFQFDGGAYQTHLRVNVTLEQLAGLDPLTLRLPNEQEPRTISLPAGVGDGDTLQLSGADQQNLLLEIRLRPHAAFTVAGRDIHSTVSIGPAEAALGARRHVSVLGGKVNLTIPPGTSSGRKLRLKGKGLPGRPAGDHLVEVRIVVPKRLDDEQRKLYEALLKLETR